MRLRLRPLISIFSGTNPSPTRHNSSVARHLGRALGREGYDIAIDSLQGLSGIAATAAFDSGAMVRLVLSPSPESSQQWYAAPHPRGRDKNGILTPDRTRRDMVMKKSDVRRAMAYGMRPAALLFLPEDISVLRRLTSCVDRAAVKTMPPMILPATFPETGRIKNLFDTLAARETVRIWQAGQVPLEDVILRKSRNRQAVLHAV